MISRSRGEAVRGPKGSRPGHFARSLDRKIMRGIWKKIGGREISARARPGARDARAAASTPPQPPPVQHVVLMWLKRPGKRGRSRATRARRAFAADDAGRGAGGDRAQRAAAECGSGSRLRSRGGDHFSRSGGAAALRKNPRHADSDGSVICDRWSGVTRFIISAFVRLDACFFLAAALLLFFCRSFPARADEVPPPFGFRWNDSSVRVERVLKGAKAKIVARRKKETAGSLDGRGTDPSGVEADAFHLQSRAAHARSSCNTNIRIGRWNITTAGWAKSGATSTRDTGSAG